jgi:signal transduction histidine kinase
MIGGNLLWLGLGLSLGWVGHYLWQMRSPQPEPIAAPRTPEASAEFAGLQEQLRQTELAYYTAVELCQFKGGFLARTSHELRSPMNGIIGLHQLILEDLTDSPEEERAFIAQANASALKMVQILDQVIDAARVTQGTVQLHLESVPLLQVLQDVQQLTHLQAQNRNLKLAIPLLTIDRTVLADSSRLRQVLVSLVDAAIAQMQEGTIILQEVAETSAETEVIHITMPIPASDWLLDLAQPPTYIQDCTVQSLDREAILRVANRAFPAPGFAFAVARSLMQSMQGDLAVMPLPDQPNLTQIRCTIPRVQPEASVD